MKASIAIWREIKATTTPVVGWLLRMPQSQLFIDSTLKKSSYGEVWNKPDLAMGHVPPFSK